MSSFDSVLDRKRRDAIEAIEAYARASGVPDEIRAKWFECPVEDASDYHENMGLKADDLAERAGMSKDEVNDIYEKAWARSRRKNR